MSKPVPMSSIKEARRLVLQGFSIERISPMVGVSESTIRKYTKAERMRAKPHVSFISLKMSTPALIYHDDECRFCGGSMSSSFTKDEMTLKECTRCGNEVPVLH